MERRDRGVARSATVWHFLPVAPRVRVAREGRMTRPGGGTGLEQGRGMRWTLFAMLALGFLSYTATMVVGAWLNPDRAPSRYRGRAVRSVAPVKPRPTAAPVALVMSGTSGPMESPAMRETSAHSS